MKTPQTHLVYCINELAMFKQALWPVLIAALVVVLQGCAMPPPLREPLVLDENYNPAAVDRITILPVADLRVDKKVNTDVSSIVQKTAVDDLKKRGYLAEPSRLAAPTANLTDADLRKPTVEWVKSLPPEDSRWVMLFAVHDVASQTQLEVIILTKTTKVELSAFLYDKRSGNCVWHDRGSRQGEVGGVLGVAFYSGEVTRETIADATSDSLAGLPLKSNR